MILGNSEIKDLGGIALGMALENSSIVRVSLGHNDIGPDGGAELFRALGAPGSRITALSLAGNPRLVEGAAVLHQVLANRKGGVEVLSATTVLETLDLRGCGLGDAEAAALAAGISQNVGIKTVLLQHNAIKGQGAVVLAQALSNPHSTVESIDLERNPIGDGGAAAFGVALKENKSLKSIKLACCGIGDEGAAGFAAGLACNNHVRAAWLDGNVIGSKGAAALADALTGNSAMIALNVRGNQMGDFGASSFATALATNTVLAELDFSTNNITNEGAVALAIMLVANTNMKDLKVGGGDEIDGTILKSISTILRANNQAEKLA